jgi:hypothetical protein
MVNIQMDVGTGYLADTSQKFYINGRIQIAGFSVEGVQEVVSREAVKVEEDISRT